MKTKIKSLLIISSFFLLSISKMSAQAGCFSNTINLPFCTEVQSANAILDFTMEPGVNPCNNSAGTYLNGIGMNQSNPQFMLDILCNGNGGTFSDINVSTTDPLQDVGYRIGGVMFSWNDGDTSSLYLGYGAGFHPTKINLNPFRNTFVGFDADGAFAGQGGVNFNTAVGAEALYNNVSYNNTAIGWQSQYNCLTGNTNTSYGVLSLYLNQTGDYNIAIGPIALFSNTVSNNIACGYAALYYNTTGPDNTALGWESGLTNTTGGHNLLLGYEANVKANNLNYATAIGSGVITSTSHQLELGDDTTTVTIGLSGIAPTTPVTKLEISTQWGGSPFTFTWTDAAPGWVNSGRGTGWSGLRFDDLKSKSTPGKNPGPGYLALDTAGNVIYVDTGRGSGSGTGIGYCTGSGLTNMTGSGGYNLNTNNFYFAGNTSGSLTQNSVVIGNPCGYTPKAKLDILQNSAYTPPSTTSSMGLYVENDDLKYGYTLPGQPVIGIESYIPDTSSQLCRSIAGYFSAPGSCPGYDVNDAIIVPPNGGLVGIGTVSPGANLEVDGYSYNLGHTLINAATGFGNVALDVTSWLPFSGVQVGILSEVNNAQSPGVPNIAIQAEADGLVAGVPNIGIYAQGYLNPAIDYAGYFEGNVYTIGSGVSGTGFLVASDSTIKTKVDSFSNALAIIKRLKPKTYYFDTTNVKNKNPGNILLMKD